MSKRGCSPWAVIVDLNRPWCWNGGDGGERLKWEKRGDAKQSDVQRGGVRESDVRIDKREEEEEEERREKTAIAVCFEQLRNEEGQWGVGAEIEEAMEVGEERPL
jgi:hypothetical protein